MNLEAFNSYCASLPSTEKVVQWGGAHVWKVGGKIFAMASLWGEETGSYKIGFKTSDMAFRMLTEQPDIEPSPYLGRYKWVLLRSSDALNENDTKAYIAMAYELIASKLTKAKRRDIGLPPKTT